MKKLGQWLKEALEGALWILAALLTPFLRLWRLRWGATNHEIIRMLPGDDLVRMPRWQYTHAITVHAPVSIVWQWLIQMGQGRGGLYSYEALENLAGSAIHNVDHIVPELQKLAVGDEIKLHPRLPGMTVAELEPLKYLLLHGDTRLDDVLPGEQPIAPPGEFVNNTWLFFLETVDDQTTRFITRTRSDYSQGMRLAMGPLLLEPLSFTMERKMLLGIKERAEAMYQGMAPATA
ncbi:MAG: hypothetical protein MUE40_11785 [Anaerolineae bacterium]|nr:hypothetical protein [Anaerolineae bacterium]